MKGAKEDNTRRILGVWVGPLRLNPSYNITHRVGFVAVYMYVVVTTDARKATSFMAFYCFSMFTYGNIEV